MSEGYHVDPAVLCSASPGFSGAADALQSARDSLTGVLEAEGACWGDDDAGQSFAQQYGPAAQQALEAFYALTEALYAVREQLDGTAGTWEGVDTGTAAGFDQAHRA